MTTTVNESAEQMIAALRGGSGRDRRMASPEYRAKLKGLSESLIGPALRGDRYKRLELHESMSTSDFPILFGDFLYRSLARRYAARPSVWRQFAAPRQVRDFRETKLIDLLGGAATLDDVAELAPYPRRALLEQEIKFKLGKTGATLAWSWEMGVNDDLSAFVDAPNRLSQAARFTEDKKVTQVIASPTGPSDFFGSVDNKPLTPENLEAAIQSITQQEDEDGNPIFIDTPRLVVPTALKLTAQQIVDTVTVKTTASNREREVRGNGLSVTPQIVENPWLTSIDKSATAASSWYLLAGPDSERPAVFGLSLTGHEAPDLRMRADAGVRPGGGEIDPTEGGFDRDDVEYRIRHVFAGAEGFKEVAYASKGA